MLRVGFSTVYIRGGVGAEAASKPVVGSGRGQNTNKRQRATDVKRRSDKITARGLV